MAWMIFVVACSSSSDSSSPTTDVLTKGLTTAIDNDTIDGWTCITSHGAPIVYFFNGPGVIPDAPPELQYGAKIDPTMSTVGEFRWEATSPDSVQLQSQEDSVQVDWSNIRFSSDTELSAYSSVAGELLCSLESTQRNGADRG